LLATDSARTGTLILKGTRRSAGNDGVPNSLVTGRGTALHSHVITNRTQCSSPSFDCRRAAPVSHQKQPARSAANVVEFYEKRRKISSDGHYPAAHNGVVPGSSSIPGPIKRELGSLHQLRLHPMYPVTQRMNAREVIAPLASYLHSRLAEFPTSGAITFHLRSCLLPCSIDFGQRREK